ncbi:MAG: HNH endonuclease [Bryobacterales bacterium]|nr:HNH endonuclease [Bryobacterales bacterium]
MTLSERFWSKVFKSDKCWLWTAGVINGGYGQIWVNGRNRYAHRLSFEIANGPIPDGLDVLHACDTPACVNPAHLYLGDDKRNAADRVARGRSAHPRGTLHPMVKLTEESVRRIYGDPRPQSVVAREFGVNQTHVSAIKSGRAWGHLRLAA